VASKYQSFEDFRKNYLGIGDESKNADENYVFNCCSAAWSYATKLVEEKFTSTNSAMDDIEHDNVRCREYHSACPKCIAEFNEWKRAKRHQ